jgi:hypothetical protein
MVSLEKSFFRSKKLQRNPDYRFRSIVDGFHWRLGRCGQAALDPADHADCAG